MKFFINSGAYPGIIHRLQERGHTVVGADRNINDYVCYSYFANPNVSMKQYDVILRRQIEEEKPDVYICCKGYFFDKYILPETTEWIRAKVGTTIYWSQDDPFFVQQFSSHYMHRGYQIALTCDMASMAVYKSLGFSYAHLWWPAWDNVDRKVSPVEEADKIDCIFAGSPYVISPLKRTDMIWSLINSGINVQLYGDKMWVAAGGKVLSGDPRLTQHYKGSWDNWSTVHTLFEKSRINFSNHIVRSPGYLNDRVFMVMGVGGFLLLDNQPEIDKFFTDGEDLVYYSDITDFKNKASYYLKNPDARNKIGENARKKILAQHTYAHRVDYLLDVLSSIGLK